MTTITINLLDTKRTVLSKNNQVYLSAPNTDYLIIAGENDTTNFAVVHNAIYDEYVFTVTMVNAKGEGIQFELVDDTFNLGSEMTVAGYTKIYITATDGVEKVAWERIDIKISSTSPDYVALTENSFEFLRYNLQTLTEAQQTQVRDNINAASKDDIRIEKYAFETYANFTDWIAGTFERVDGILPTDLEIGDEILLVETDKPDYWLKSQSDPITIADFAISETDLSNYVEKMIITEDYVGDGVYTWNTAENKEKYLQYMENPAKYNLLFSKRTDESRFTYYNCYSLLKYTSYTIPPNPTTGEVYYHLGFDFKTLDSIITLDYRTDTDEITISMESSVDYTADEKTKLAGIDIGVEVIVDSAGDVSQELSPNIFYNFTGALTSLILTLETAVLNKENEYKFQFLSGSSVPTLSIPSTIIWIDTGIDITSLTADTIYQVSILNNIGIIVGVSSV